MTKQKEQIIMQNTNKRLITWAIVVAAIQMIPLLTRAPWTFGDYVFASVVLFGLAAGYELITKNMTNTVHRIAISIGAFCILIAIWAWAVA